jgi:hypothetical protein
VERYLIFLQAISKSICREKPVRPWIDGLRVAEANRWFARSWVGRWARPLCFDIVRLPLSPGSRFLDALIDSGISLVEGGCGTCETRVIEGMPDHREQFLSKQEQETSKTIMICYSGAKSKKLTLDL